MRGKADLTLYRNASSQVLAVLSGMDERIVVERASIDEAYLDLTRFVSAKDFPFDVSAMDMSQVFIAGHPDVNICQYEEQVLSTGTFEEKALLTATRIVKELRDRIKLETGYVCSAGISYNKVLAKLACGIRKPNGQTILPRSGVRPLFKTIPIKKVRGLGGKMGAQLSENFQTEMIGDLEACSLAQLAQVIGNRTAPYIYGLIRGDDDEMVLSRVVSQSVGCAKNFPGLKTIKEVEHWVKQLSEEMVERLEENLKENQRRAQNMVVGVRFASILPSFSKTLKIKEYATQSVFQEIMGGIQARILRMDGSVHPIITLSLTAAKFSDCPVLTRNSRTINHFYRPVPKKARHETQELSLEVNNQFENLEGSDEEQEAGDQVGSLGCLPLIDGNYDGSDRNAGDIEHSPRHEDEPLMVGSEDEDSDEEESSQELLFESSESSQESTFPEELPFFLRKTLECLHELSSDSEDEVCHVEEEENIGLIIIADD